MRPSRIDSMSVDVVSKQAGLQEERVSSDSIRRRAAQSVAKSKVHHTTESVLRSKPSRTDLPHERGKRSVPLRTIAMRATSMAEPVDCGFRAGAGGNGRRAHCTSRAYP
jgi:hypothetical protein